MNRPVIRIHDLATDSILDREMNDDEFEQFEIDQKNYSDHKIKIEQIENEKQALLSKLNISAEELKTILG